MSFKYCTTFCISVLLSASTFVQAQMLTSTPSEDGFIPVISDFEMNQCKKLFDRAEEAYSKLLGMPYDPNDSKLVRNVRNQYDLHGRIVEQFNRVCAGKQSLSSCEKTKKARAEKGLPYQDCRIAKK